MSFKALHKIILTKNSYIIQKIAYKITHIPKPKFPAENNNKKGKLASFSNQKQCISLVSLQHPNGFFFIHFPDSCVTVKWSIHHTYVNKSNQSDDDRSNQQPFNKCTVTLNFVKQVFPLLHLIKIVNLKC